MTCWWYGRNQTGSRIQIWWTFAFKTGNSYVSAVDWALTTKFGLLIDTDILKTATSPKSETGSKIAPQLPPSWKTIKSYLRWRWTDLDEIRQRNAEWHAMYGAMVKIETGNRTPICRTVVFLNRKYLYLGSGLRYVDEIWFTDRCWRSELSDITKYFIVLLFS